MAKNILLDINVDTQVIEDRTYLKVCEESDLPGGSGLRIQFGDEFSEIGDLELALINDNGKVYAVSNICPHKHAPKIADGIIKNGTVTCPLHAWCYRLDTGENTNTHDGIKKLDTYDTLILNSCIYIRKPEPKIPAWRTALL
jgi:nitrite reductase/ring-hydroxylating ferredoxin subunit